MTVKKEQPEKRGVKAHFTGSCEVFLKENLEEYIKLRNKDHSKFWFRILAEWWVRYPWRLPDEKEPPTDDPEEMGRLAFAGEEDLDEKAQVERVLQGRIKNWYSYRASTRYAGRKGGKWTPIIKRLHQQASTKPCCRTAVQQLMQEERALVDEAFRKKYGNGSTLGRGERMNKRNEVAKDLLATKFRPEDVAGLEERAKKEHERATGEWGLDLESIGEADDVDAARDSMFSVVHPLLKFIGGYFGCYVTLLAAAPDPGDGKPYFSVIHYFPENARARVNWTDFDTQTFKSGVVGSLFKYVRWMGRGFPSFIRATQSNHFPEEEGDKGEGDNATTPGTSQAPSTRPSSTEPPNLTAESASSETARPNVIPYKSGGYKKRAFVDADSTSGEENDTDMDDIEDNDSSGSSVVSGHAPAKRLRTSMATRSSRAAHVPKEPTPQVVTPRTLLTTSNKNSTPRNPDASFTQSCSEPIGMDVDKSHRGAGSHNRADVSDVPIHLSDSVPTTVQPGPSSPSSNPGIDPEPPVPEFLLGKQNVYSYLCLVKESGFQGLLKKYIAFELSDSSGIHGILPTFRRPKAIGWWSGRARPNKLPPYDGLGAFSASIVAWWISLQPAWRTIQLGEVVRESGEFDNWELLYQPGINGLLNVVVLASWWARISEEREEPVDEAYSWFVSDVSWVLTQLATVAPDAH